MSLPDVPTPDAPHEPLITVGAITGIASGILAAAVSFGLKLTPEQTAAIVTLIGLVAPIVVALWGRRKVFSPATVRAMVRAAQNK